MHKRVDRPATDPSQRHHVLSGGLDAVWTRTHRTAAHEQPFLAEAA